MARVKVKYLGDGIYRVRVVRSRLRERLGGRPVDCSVRDIADVVLEELPRLAPAPNSEADVERHRKVYNTVQ